MSRASRSGPTARTSPPLLVALALVALAVALAWPASRACAQSPFALTNIGQNIWNGDARIAGRGGWGMTVADTLALGFKNISGLVDNPFVGVHLTAFGELVSAEENGQERRTSRTFAPDFRLSIPIAPRRLALTAGLRSRRTTQYDAVSDTSWEVDEGTLHGNLRFERDGSQLEIPLGAAFRVGSHLAVGATLNLLGGTVVDTRRTISLTLERPDGSVFVSPYLSAREETEDIYDGVSYTASALLDGLGPFRLGFAYTPEHDLSVDRTISLSGVAARHAESYELKMPAEYLAGFELQLGSRWRLGGDLQFMEYSAFSGQPEWEPDMEDEWTVAAGFERILARERRGGHGNLPLRLGVMRRQWAYKVGGEAVTETVFSAGTGFSLQGGAGQLDVALSYGSIGSVADNGVAADYWRLTVSVTGLERWW
jgi:hypothetical protein